MGTFNPDTFKSKLENLNNTQASIETLSNWCQFYRKQAQTVVSGWESEFTRAPSQRRVHMLYLANDILQNSRKKGPEFQASFFNVLPRALKHALKDFDDTSRGKVSRLITVWDDRKVFGSSGARTIKDLLAEADTPRKKLPIGRNSGHARGSAATVLPDEDNATSSMHPELLPVSKALKVSAEATKSSAALGGRCAAVVQPGLFENGSAEELAGAEDVLRHHSIALEAECSSLDATIRTIQEMLARQTEARRQAQNSLAATERQLSSVSSCLAELAPDKMFSPPLPPPESVSSPAVCLPLPALEPQKLPAPSSAPSPPPGLSLSQPSLLAASTLPKHSPQAIHVNDSGASDMDVDIAQQPAPLPSGQHISLPHLQHDNEPSLSSSNTNSAGNQAAVDINSSSTANQEAATAAAALVAQLSAAQDSQALLEALAALPQDQQREISLNLFSIKSMGAPSGSASLVGEDEEYDPEDAAF